MINTLELLEKAAGRLITLIRVRNLATRSRYDSDLSAMVNILKVMGFEVDFEWNNDAIERIMVSLDGEKIERVVY